MVPCGHAGELPDDDQVWRRFISSPNHRTWDSDVGRYIPNLGDLQFDPEMSTYWRQHLRMHGKGPSSVLEGDSRYDLVGQLAINQVRGEGFPVEQTPHQESPIGCAHVSIYWPPESIQPGHKEPFRDQRKLLRTKLAHGLTWVHGEMPTIGPPGA